MMERSWKPDAFGTDLLAFDYLKWFEAGKRVVFVDLDNTLSAHGSRQPDRFAMEAIERIRSSGLIPVLLSNGATSRVKQFAQAAGMDYIGRAGKPSIRALRKKLAHLGFQPDQAVLIGDQILTDVWAARRLGCLAVLVRPRFRREAVNVRAKRLLERVLYRSYGLTDPTR